MCVCVLVCIRVYLHLGHFQVVVTVIGALWKVYIPYGSLIEALYTLNSPPVVSFNFKLHSGSAGRVEGLGAL